MYRQQATGTCRPAVAVAPRGEGGPEEATVWPPAYSCKKRLSKSYRRWEGRENNSIGKLDGWGNKLEE